MPAGKGQDAPSMRGGKKFEGAYGGFVKPNPSAFKPLDGKVKGLLGAKANKERLEK